MESSQGLFVSIVQVSLLCQWPGTSMKSGACLITIVPNSFNSFFRGQMIRGVTLQTIVDHNCQFYYFHAVSKIILRGGKSN